MNEKDLGAILLHGEQPIDLKSLTNSVLARDRRRTREWAVACVVAWMVVVALAWATILPMLAKVTQYNLHVEDRAKMTAAQQHAESMEMANALRGGTVATFFGSLATTLIAAICTVALVTHTRRATLRQVNAKLAEISEQLKHLARPPAC